MADTNIQDLINQVLIRLEDVQTKQSSMSRQLDSTSEQVTELYRTLRGSNGHPGIVTEVALLREKINAMSGNDAKSDREMEKADSNKITYSWFIEKVIFPVITPAVVAVIIYLLFNVVPHVKEVIP